MDVPVGVANSISANFGYDPLDALHFAIQSNFHIIQIYLNQELLENSAARKDLRKGLQNEKIKKIYFHVEGLLNKEFTESEYFSKVTDFLSDFDDPVFIIHYDEASLLDDILLSVGKITKRFPVIYLENYYRTTGVENAEKNMRKFMALFSLANSQADKIRLMPVLDVPRLFHEKLQMKQDLAMQWCFQIINYFGNRSIPILLHLIDSQNSDQNHTSFCPIGEGYIPYQELFNFIKKTRPRIEGIILEFEDKINSLKSRERILRFLAD